MQHAPPLETPLGAPSLREVWDQERVLEQLCSGRRLARLALRSAWTALLGSALFGAALGSYTGAPLPMLVSALKVPLLLAGTATICFPTFFVVQALRSGRPLTAARALVLQTNALAVVGLVWGSFSLPVLFLLGTTGHYVLAQWLALGIGIAGGFAGFSRFLAGYLACTSSASRGVALHGLGPYFVLFAAVGGQLAWTLRPFIGSPSQGFQVFRELDGNIFVHVLGLLFG